MDTNETADALREIVDAANEGVAEAWRAATPPPVPLNPKQLRDLARNLDRLSRALLDHALAEAEQADAARDDDAPLTLLERLHYAERLAHLRLCHIVTIDSLLGLIERDDVARVMPASGHTVDRVRALVDFVISDDFNRRDAHV
jgi:hypothetical protein